MFKKLVSQLLIFSLTLPAFANVGEAQPSDSETSAILTVLRPEFIKAELRELKDEHDKINSWNDIKSSLETLQPEDKSFLMTKFNEWEKEPFRKPTFDKTDDGFILKDGKSQIKINLVDGTLMFNEKVLTLQGKSLRDIYLWLDPNKSTSSISSFFISEAHAIPPLIIGLISFAITAIGMLWNNSCKEAYMKTENRIDDLYGTCNWDREEGRSSPEIRQLLKDINSTENSILRSGRTCEQQIKDSHKWLFFLSCSENAAGICSKINKLSICLTAIKNRGPVNDSRIWMERPLPTGTRQRTARPRGRNN